MKKNINLYEQFHENSKFQKVLVGEDDYVYGPILKKLVRYIPENSNILDIGCGVGLVDLFLASRGHKVLGIDISAKAVNIAKSSAKYLNLNNNVSFVKKDIAKSRIRRRFGAVICLEVLEHLPDDSKLVARINKMLIKGGVVIASSPSKNAPLYKIGFLNNFDKRVGHLRRYTSGEFKKLFTMNNFEIMKIIRNEGIFRNFLFTSKIGGVIIKLLKRKPFSSLLNIIDRYSLSVFGESDYCLFARKK